MTPLAWLAVGAGAYAVVGALNGTAYGLLARRRELLNALAADRTPPPPDRAVAVWAGILWPLFLVAASLDRIGTGTRGLVDRGLTATITDDEFVEARAAQERYEALAAAERERELRVSATLYDFHADAQRRTANRRRERDA